MKSLVIERLLAIIALNWSYYFKNKTVLNYPMVVGGGLKASFGVFLGLIFRNIFLELNFTPNVQLGLGAHNFLSLKIFVLQLLKD